MRKVKIRDAFSVHLVSLELEHFGHTPAGRGGSLKEGKRKVSGWRKSSQRRRYWSSSVKRIYIPWRSCHGD